MAPLNPAELSFFALLLDEQRANFFVVNYLRELSDLPLYSAFKIHPTTCVSSCPINDLDEDENLQQFKDKLVKLESLDPDAFDLIRVSLATELSTLEIMLQVLSRREIHAGLKRLKYLWDTIVHHPS